MNQPVSFNIPLIKETIPSTGHLIKWPEPELWPPYFRWPGQQEQTALKEL